MRGTAHCMSKATLAEDAVLMDFKYMNRVEALPDQVGFRLRVLCWLFCRFSFCLCHAVRLSGRCDSIVTVVIDVRVLLIRHGPRRFFPSESLRIDVIFLITTSTLSSLFSLSMGCSSLIMFFSLNAINVFLQFSSVTVIGSLVHQLFLLPRTSSVVNLGRRGAT